MLYIVRHGRTKVNAAGKLLGRSDPELDEIGRKQASDLANRLGEIDLVISSPLKRTMETASYISSTVETDPRWLELDYGTLEGRSIESIDDEVWKKWRSDIHWAPDKGESLGYEEYNVNKKGIKALNNLKGHEAIPVIKEFFVRCRNYRSNLGDDYDSPNGWGTVEVCIVLMGQLLVDCIENPYKEIWVN